MGHARTGRVTAFHRVASPWPVDPVAHSSAAAIRSNAWSRDQTRSANARSHTHDQTRSTTCVQGGVGIRNSDMGLISFFRPLLDPPSPPLLPYREGVAHP